jgi:hypothetical protein
MLLGLAWAGIGAASSAAARSRQEKRIKKGKEDIKDIERRKVAQTQAEQNMFTALPAMTPTMETYTPTGGTATHLQH